MTWSPESPSRFFIRRTPHLKVYERVRTKAGLPCGCARLPGEESNDSKVRMARVAFTRIWLSRAGALLALLLPGIDVASVPEAAAFPSRTSAFPRVDEGPAPIPRAASFETASLHRRDSFWTISITWRSAAMALREPATRSSLFVCTFLCSLLFVFRLLI